MNLLPCPFCGSTNIDPEGWASTDRSGPACDDCSGTADTVELWNSRPSGTAAVGRREDMPGGAASSPPSGWEARTERGDGWRADMLNAPRDRPYLVEEKIGDRVRYHVAEWRGSVFIVGGHFDFDRGPLTRWKLFDLPTSELSSEERRGQ